ncbi:hypothetical protein ElyMa_003847900 [Elysia marginata]|uniref:Uncharacterized protein n=1 Tax=Elysia marginata TaxID=1093978 RepID=A0AAV4FHZ8_9GAST|nr:hypothetical protein ElyMa_003847900 [Elysia marginata]
MDGNENTTCSSKSGHRLGFELVQCSSLDPSQDGGEKIACLVSEDLQQKYKLPDNHVTAQSMNGLFSEHRSGLCGCGGGCGGDDEDDDDDDDNDADDDNDNDDDDDYDDHRCCCV